MKPILLVIITSFPILFGTYDPGENIWNEVTKLSKVGEY